MRQQERYWCPPRAAPSSVDPMRGREATPRRAPWQRARAGPCGPTRTLHLLASAGDDLASRHGTCTTTDWGLLTQEELCMVCDDGGIEGEWSRFAPIVALSALGAGSRAPRSKSCGNKSSNL